MNAIADTDIKKCKKCNLSKKEGSVFGFGKPYTTKSGLSVAATEYRKNNLDKTRAAKQKRKEKFKGTILYHVQNKINSYKYASSSTGIESDLTVDYLVDLYDHQSGLCHYTNEKLIFGYVNGKIHHNSISLDKLDPSKGYVIGNVVWCNYLVNTMKQSLTEEEFFAYIKNILIIGKKL